MVDAFINKLKPRKKRCKKCKESTVHEYAWWAKKDSVCPFFKQEEMICGCSEGSGNKVYKDKPCIGPLRLAPFCLQCGHHDLPAIYQLHGVLDVEDV